jgi:hypothetical protein
LQITPNQRTILKFVPIKNEKMDYPQYRMYSDGNTLFMIHSADYFTEIKRAGIYFIESEVKCNQYPEKVFLNDLINSENNIKIISEEYYNIIKSDWNNSLKKF